MITLVLTNRNRDLNIIKKCLESISRQSNNNFECFLVDYGSEFNYLASLKELLQQFPKIQFIQCPVSGQLWNKSRAINIALQQTVTTYFVVGDIDLIFSPKFIQKCYDLMKINEVNYFQYGFLSQTESLLNKEFKDYEIDFIGNHEVTGTTIFPTETLKKLNGYDEFYHGWGAEDTDVHVRMKNSGIEVCFFNQEILVKHQWHAKAYRSKQSHHPFHSQLERINHDYMYKSIKSNRTIVNCKMGFGKEVLISDYESLNKKSNFNFHINNSQIDLEGLLSQMSNFSRETIEFKITPVGFISQVKNTIKRFLGKKYIPYLSMENINNRLLLEIINNYRNNPYEYTFDRQKKNITLIISF